MSDVGFLSIPRKTWAFSLVLETAKAGVGDASSEQFCLLLSGKGLYLPRLPDITNAGLSHWTQCHGK